MLLKGLGLCLVFFPGRFQLRLCLYTVTVWISPGPGLDALTFHKLDPDLISLNSGGSSTDVGDHVSESSGPGPGLVLRLQSLPSRWTLHFGILTVRVIKPRILFRSIISFHSSDEAESENEPSGRRPETLITSVSDIVK